MFSNEIHKFLMFSNKIFKSQVKGTTITDLETSPVLEHVAENRLEDVTAYLNGANDLISETTNQIDLVESSNLIFTVDEPPPKKLKTIEIFEDLAVTSTYSLRESSSPKVLNKFPMQNAKAFKVEKVVKCYGAAAADLELDSQDVKEQKDVPKIAKKPLKISVLERPRTLRPSKPLKTLKILKEEPTEMSELREELKNMQQLMQEMTKKSDEKV